jgi:hypothetical protein
MDVRCSNLLGWLHEHRWGLSRCLLNSSGELLRLAPLVELLLRHPLWLRWLNLLELGWLKLILIQQKVLCKHLCRTLLNLAYGSGHVVLGWWDVVLCTTDGIGDLVKVHLRLLGLCYWLLDLFLLSFVFRLLSMRLARLVLGRILVSVLTSK